MSVVSAVNADRLTRIFSEESGLPLPMAKSIIRRILSDAKNPTLLKRLQKKLARHPVLGRAKTWAWVAPGNVPDPIALAVTAARVRRARLVLKLSRRAARTGRALAAALKGPGQRIRIVLTPADFKKYSRRADAWIAYGSDATVRTVLGRAPAASGRVAHGDRISFSVVFRSALGPKGPAGPLTSTGLNRVAARAAEDIWLYDQRGCLSPQIVWVEGEAAARRFAPALLERLRTLNAQSGPIRRHPEDQAARRRVLNELRVRALNKKDLTVLRHHETPITPSLRGARRRSNLTEDHPEVYFLNHGSFTTPAVGQIIAVKSFRRSADIRQGMHPFLTHLQGISIAGTRRESARLRQIFADTPATRSAPLGRLQSPPLDWQL